MLQQVSSHQLAEWAAYFKIEPFGEDRANYRAALIACTVANAMRSADTDPYEIESFLLTFEQATKQQVQSWEEQLAIVEMLNAAFGGQDLRK